VISVGLSTVKAAATVPKWTAVAPVKFTPVMMTMHKYPIVPSSHAVGGRDRRSTICGGPSSRGVSIHSAITGPSGFSIARCRTAEGSDPVGNGLDFGLECDAGHSDDSKAAAAVNAALPAS